MTPPNTPKAKAARTNAVQDQIGRSIKHYLDASAINLDSNIAQKLVVARRAALVAMNSRTAATSVAVGGGALARTHGRTEGEDRAMFWGVGLFTALALAIYGGIHFDQNRRAVEAAEADIEILASDVPIDAYFDQGFKSWVQQGK